MKERPILFSAPMVRAILDGSKTQTRRLMKTQPFESLLFSHLPKAQQIRAWLYGRFCIDQTADREQWAQWSPYGVPGDRLWVRETWQAHSKWSRVKPSEIEPHDVAYFADRARELKTWRPSIFMPRWASRITLEVTAVRVERLQYITDADAKAEGVDNGPGRGGHLYPSGRSARGPLGHHRVFAELWDTINGKRAPWASNPWVWVISFKRLGDA